MKTLTQILISLNFLIPFFSCTQQETKSNFAFIYDIRHYAERTERSISSLAQEIELEGRRPIEVNAFKKLDSCLLLRKQLFLIINEDSINIKEISISDYRTYLNYLNSIKHLVKDNENSKKLYSSSNLEEIPSKIDLEYILHLVRYEHAIVENYLSRISPIYCGYGNRVYAMQENKPFQEDQNIDVLLISDFSTSQVSDFRFTFYVDSITIDDVKHDIVNELKTIDRIAYLNIQAPKKGDYRIYGRTKVSWKSQKDSVLLGIDSYPFSAGITIE